MKEVFQTGSVGLKNSLFQQEIKEDGVNTRQVLTGLFVLLVGAFFYYFCRPVEHTYFLQFLSNNSYIKDFISPGYNLIGNSLPTFIHVVAFTLMTAGIIARRKTGYMNVCFFWFVVDCLFEVGQGLETMIIPFIPDWFSDFVFLENTRNYFLRGRFGYFDLLSIALGSLAAYIILIKTSDDKEGAS